MNKKVLHCLILLALTPVVAHAEYPNMSQEQMQNMMAQAQKMQACFSQVDPAAMQKMAEQGQAFQAEISAMCKSGDRDGAQERAMAYAKEMMNDKAFQVMKKCGEEMAQTMPQMNMVKDYSDAKQGHVCDNH
ncbi:hypothetical protein [Methylobacter sp. BlB1]|uniref:hypothetical protein n=1 Tax=Methylobacter sp. BlB1 TaxID=2785914 RepID=UPI001895331A|nr:hypothetical protein [Methylobacter sp. BlB1]MBF6649637.1 hypothetical protein [Methylobacter sp. BlB1]